MAGRVDKAVYQLIVALFAGLVLNVFSFVLCPVFIIWAWKVCADSDKVPQEGRAADMKLLLEAQHRQLLQATNPDAFKELIQREDAERVAKAKAREEQLSVQSQQIKTGVIIVGALVACLVVVGLIASAFSTFTRSVQSTQSSTAAIAATGTWARFLQEQHLMPQDYVNMTSAQQVKYQDLWRQEYPATAAEATPSPPVTVESSPTSEPSIVNYTPSPTPGSSATYTYIPNPSDEQALATFNDLQDQSGKPHTDHVTYYAKDDSYHWIGPKYHKPMKMTRQEFDVEVWNPYYKKLHSLSTPVGNS
jgi:hypothetical protein